MSRPFAIACLFLACLFIACDSDDGKPAPSGPQWQVEFIVVGGTTPVISPDDSAFLFLREGEGLYLWRNGTETRITPEGLPVRPDYSWSVSGENYFAFSYPGAPGDGGIVISEAGGTLTPVWDRGSAPIYDAAQNTVICAGPQEIVNEAGIVQILLPELDRTLLLEQGVAPQFAFGDSLFAYLIPQPGSSGSQFVLRNRHGLTQPRTLDYVARFRSRPELSSLIVEIIANSEGLAMPPALYKVIPSDPLVTHLIAQPATNPCLLSDGSILYNELNGNVLGRLILLESGNEHVLSDTLFASSANNFNTILAAGPSGISRLTRL